MPPIAKIDVTLEDGSVVTFNAHPVVEPDQVEVDLILSDGSKKVFVPKAE